MIDPVKLASRLVSVPSVSPMGQPPGEDTGEGRLTDLLEQVFREAGIPTVRQTVAPGRENILAILERPGSARTLLLDAHQDTVSVSGMTIPPFEGAVHDGRLWGRGACDVKGGMAAMIAALARAAAEPRGASVILSCSADEEHSFRGVNRLLEGPWRPGKPDMAVIGEPTRMRIVIAHKGFMRWKISTRGKSVHSANPRLGVNAILKMTEVIRALDEYAKDLERGPAHPLLGRPTMNVGTIHGGSGANIVPDTCTIEIDRRVIPGEDPAAVFAACRGRVMARLGGDFPLSFHEPWHAEPVLDTPESSEVVGLCRGAVREVLGEAETTGVPYGTNACTISADGIPSVVMGPGDIGQAHTPDEWIETAEIEKAAEVYFALIRRAGEL